MFDRSRYTFKSTTDHNNQTIFIGEVTISPVQFEDSAVFTCEAVHPASPVGAPKLNVRVRVRGELVLHDLHMFFFFF